MEELNAVGRVGAATLLQEQGRAVMQRWLAEVSAELQGHLAIAAGRAADRRKPRAITSGIVADGSGFVLYLGSKRICLQSCDRLRGGWPLLRGIARHDSSPDSASGCGLLRFEHHRCEGAD